MCNGLNEEGKALMECRLCAEIVHPECVDVEEDSYRIVSDINNCWECPKCCTASENVSTRTDEFDDRIQQEY